MSNLNFNPRSPYGERQGLGGQGHGVADISIHAPLAGSDPPCQCGACPQIISIHAPLTGSDFWPSFLKSFQMNFNPRSPYGERR